MAVKLDRGELTLRLHYGKDLKNADWFGKQDPYVILKCGDTKYRSNTHFGGGCSPVWNQQFCFKVDQETSIEVEVRDQDWVKDDFLGKGQVDIVSVRNMPNRSHDAQVLLFRRFSGRQQGFLFVSLTFQPSSAITAPSCGMSTANGAVTTAAAAAPENSFRTDADMSTMSAHERQAAAATYAAAAVAEENEAALRDVGSGGTVTPAASAHFPASGSSLPAGLVAPGGLPDTVPSYAPTVGLIEPQFHQMLPCHQGRVNGSNTGRTQPAAQGAPSTPPGVSPAAPGGPPVAAAPLQLYSAVHTQPSHLGEGFALATGHMLAPTPVAAQAYPQQTQPLSPVLQPSYSQPVSQMYFQQPPPIHPTYSHDWYGGAPPRAPVGYPPMAPPLHYGAPPPYGAPHQYAALPAPHPPPQPQAYGAHPPPPGFY